ncbi:hypothetical protein ACVCAH_00460 [Micromonospora sp. LZ34]
MARLSRIVAALLVSGALVACDDGSSPPTGAPSPTPSAAPPSSAAPLTLEHALARFVADTYGPDVRYVGRCADASPGAQGVCALHKATVDGAEVYGVGPPFSEIDAFLLLDEEAGGWRVVDSYVPDLPAEGSSARPAPAWFAGIG